MADNAARSKTKPTMGELFAWTERSVDVGSDAAKRFKSAFSALATIFYQGVDARQTDYYAVPVAAFVDWLSHLLHGDIATASDLKPGTVATYSSIVRTGVEQFLMEYDANAPTVEALSNDATLRGVSYRYAPSEFRGASITTRFGATGSHYISSSGLANMFGSIQRAPDLRTEIDEALTAMVRWPRIRARLMPILMKVIDELEEEERRRIRQEEDSRGPPF